MADFDAYNDYSEFDDFQDYESEELIEDYDEDCSEAEKARMIRQKIGLGILRDITDEEKDDIFFLAAVRRDYCLTLSTVMAFSSERLTDLFSVGEVYLSPLFRSKTEKDDYIVRKLEQYEQVDGRPLKYNEKLILTKVYNVPNEYARIVSKFMYTKDEFEKPTIRAKIFNLFKKIRQRQNDNKYITDEQIKHYKELYNDVINGRRAKNLKWLINLNRQRAEKFANESIDDYGQDKVMYINDENLVIYASASTISKILKKEKITLNDKEILDDAFEKINNYVILAANEYKASNEMGLNK